MATTSYVISSHYDPADRKRLEEEIMRDSVGDMDEEITPKEDAAWRKESMDAFPYSRLRTAPRFVPATYSELDVNILPPSTSQLDSSSANWYKQLRMNHATTSTPSRPPPRSLPLPAPPSAAPQPSKRSGSSDPWFIRKALPATKSLPSTSTSSLSDILVRDPPPLPTEEKFQPRVWLTIGPSNRGFGMLSRQGWNEGEALGTSVTRRPPARTNAKSQTGSKSGDPIDLTQSTTDSDDSDFIEDDEVKITHRSASGVQADMEGRKALITPLPIRLKSDRLGIGLKAKTVGPYKASQSRVTPNTQALLAHTRAAEKLRREKKLLGKGKRGFERKRKVEVAKRKNLLAYMNS